MSAIKFSKQYIEPNPSEIDYWIDLSTDQYGGRIKYFNGVDWIDLVNSDGAVVNLNDYYNKIQINSMLSTKASIDSVNTKIDISDVDDVIKNIEIKDRRDNGIELVLLKYNNTTVGVTIPTASSTTSGVVTAESFKDFVKQHLLLKLYTELYNKLSEIRTIYLKKLKAGKNIIIDETTNTISSTGKVSVNWEDIIDKPLFENIYSTKDELIDGIDEAKQYADEILIWDER